MMRVLALLGIACVIGAFMSTAAEREAMRRRWIKPAEPWLLLASLVILGSMFGPMIWRHVAP